MGSWLLLYRMTVECLFWVTLMIDDIYIHSYQLGMRLKLRDGFPPLYWFINSDRHDDLDSVLFVGAALIISYTS
jgi:hypothetical protein